MEGLSFKQPGDTQEVEAGAGADGRLLGAGDHHPQPKGGQLRSGRKPGCVSSQGLAALGPQ